jgi:predicted transposase/invertase (TIGR01784 family)
MKTNVKLFDPKIDVAFKMIFSDTEEGKIALMSLLNCILELDESDKIEDISFLNTIHIAESLEEKESIMDVRVQTTQGFEIDIEMQLKNNCDYIKRSLYYLSKLLSKQHVRGKNYDSLNKSISINILDFNLFSESSNLHHTYRFKEQFCNFELTDAMELHFIELPKIKNYLINLSKLEHGISEFEQWAFFLKYATDDSKHDIIEHIINSVEGIKMAHKSLIKVSSDEQKQAIYDSREKFINDLHASMFTAKQEGKHEERIRFAKYLLSNGLDVAEVADITQLKLKEINELIGQQ